MRTSLIFTVILFSLLIGCDSGANITVAPLSNASKLNQTAPGEAPGSVALLAGATFASVMSENLGQKADSNPVRGSWHISFTNDSVTWVRGGSVETGTYRRNDDGSWMAQFPEQDVTFNVHGAGVIWDSSTYLRTTRSAFDSRESLIAYLDGTRYDSVEPLDLGKTATGELAVGNWSVQFNDSEVTWLVQDTVSAGTYDYINDAEFALDVITPQVNAVVLANGNLLINSQIYEQAVVSQFSSQETLVNFLSGNSYRSTELKPITGISDGVVALGYWFVDFTDNTVTWSHRGISQAGTVEFLDADRFTVVFSDDSHTVNVDNDDISFAGTRYRRVVGE